MDFNWLSDGRDLRRAVDAFRWMARELMTGPAAKFVDAPFASSFSERVRRMSKPSVLTSAFTHAAGCALDLAGRYRGALIDGFVSEAPPLCELLSDEERLADYLLNNVVGGWHPAGTCRMGRSSEPASVTDSSGRVLGVDQLFIADASIMPRITRTNTNIPCVMIAERIARKLRAS